MIKVELPSLLVLCIGRDCQRSIVVQPLRGSLAKDLVRSSTEIRKWSLTELPDGVSSLSHAVVVIVGYCSSCCLRQAMCGMDSSTTVDVDYVMGMFERQIRFAEAELQKTAVLLTTLDWSGSYCEESQNEDDTESVYSIDVLEEVTWVLPLECDTTGLVCAVESFTVDSIPYTVCGNNAWSIGVCGSDVFRGSVAEGFFMEFQE
jgi:hypothetical protein